ncbi:hypothetical protein NA644_12325 [Pseudomonas stutzeri]|jgi:hypothetical protein|uniref:Uncharacterized protein n=1 Tax=Stutzerimonas stutzeri TaxID=316 RepID=A0A2N8SN98_STUST|nr:hypothetical protein [Stutzerimonas stutzeri]EQM76398.1 hypothetical protein L686_17140 [Stutzerimonas stutzeri MF28]MCQ4250092.1 hypothetical protein [Stutzerimonas stutzeri]PNG03966.1 hypothetical protein CXL00_17430 [Stutzerimonas stutzeri]
MNKELDEALNRKAWTLAIATWLVGAAVLYTIHILVGEISSRDLRWWIDAGLYVVEFFFFLSIGALHDLFLKWVYRRAA